MFLKVARWTHRAGGLPQDPCLTYLQTLLKTLFCDRVTVVRLLVCCVLTSALETSCVCQFWSLLRRLQALWHREWLVWCGFFTACSTTGFDPSWEQRNFMALSKLQDLGVLPRTPGTGWTLWCIQALSFANIWGMRHPPGRENQLVCNGMFWSRWSEDWDMNKLEDVST